MKTNGKHIFAILLTVIFILTFTTQSALAVAIADNSYTYDEIKSILSCNYDVTELTENGDIAYNSTNFPTRTRYALDEGTYYMCFINDATMLETDGETFTNGPYEKYVAQQLWCFDIVSDGVFCIRLYNDYDYCLKVNPEDGSVYVGEYIKGDSNQNWTLYISYNGNRITSKSDNTNVRNKNLAYDPGTNGIVVKDSIDKDEISYFGFFDISWWIPCTRIDTVDYSLTVGDKKLINFTCYGEDNQATTESVDGPWFEYTIIDNTSDAKIVTLSESKMIEAKFPGVARITVSYRIAEIASFSNVTVNMDGILPVNPVVQAEDDWCWAACGEMIGKYYSPETIVDQYYLADVYINSANDSMNPLELEHALKNACDLKYDFKLSESNSAIDWCRQLIDMGPTVMILLNKDQKNSHAIVLIGCSVSGTFDNTIYSFTYIDPFDGLRYTCKYGDFFDYEKYPYGDFKFGCYYYTTICY